MKKLFNTIGVCFTLFLARTFGTYIESGWNGIHDYAIYKWRGKSYTFPLSENDEEGFW